MDEQSSYSQAGVDIDAADETKKAMAASMATTNPRVLNTVGAFASLFDARFPDYRHPVLVLKTEEPGSKQKLAFQHGRVASICHDLINHLVNDIIVMGATPLAVQDAIICGRLEKEVVAQVVQYIAQACQEQDCALTGGETSEQPGVLAAGTYILTASIVGVVEKTRIIDGSRIQPGDVVLALASNGVHTNGYSLIRKLLEADPGLIDRRVAGESFLEAILRPHRPYYHDLRDLLPWPELHGLAHITGGGLRDNPKRILPPAVSARIDLAQITILPVFRAIRDAGKITDAEMLRVFNLGVGMVAIVDPSAATTMQEHLLSKACECYPIGEIVPGDGSVVFEGKLRWPARGIG